MGWNTSFLSNCIGNACARTLHSIPSPLSIRRWSNVRCDWRRGILLLRELCFVASSRVGWTSAEENLLWHSSARVVCQHSTLCTRKCLTFAIRHFGQELVLTVFRLLQSTSSFDYCEAHIISLIQHSATGLSG